MNCNLPGIPTDGIGVVLVTSRLFKILKCSDSDRDLQAEPPRLQRKHLHELIAKHKEPSPLTFFAFNPVCINELERILDHDYSRFFVLDKDGSEFIPITELHTEEWLAQRKLGSIYEDGGFEE